jgi:hypothetical protein
MENLMVLFFGILFGIVVQYARVNRTDVITGTTVLDEFTVAKVLALAVGTAAIIIDMEIAMGVATYHVKPLVLGGVVWGGIVFGAGIAILGYCPGTMPISAGQGSMDAAFGIIGGLLGGLVYTLVHPFIEPALGPNFGDITMHSILGDHKLALHLFTLAFGALAIGTAFAVDRRQKSIDRRWVVTGLGLAILNAIIMLDVVSNRPIGASTSYPFLADVIASATDNEYFRSIHVPGQWEMVFLCGAFISGLGVSLWKKEFKIQIVHSRWAQYMGDSTAKRIIWSLVGGFILIFGARMAGGCTSGHILSGGMQLAMSSLIFAAFVFISLILTGKLFYSNARRRK